MDQAVLSEITSEKLFHPNNVRATLHLTIRLVVLVTLGFIVVNCSMFSPIGLICWLLYSFIFGFLGMAGIGHEMLHGRVFHGKKLNSFFFNIFMILTWSNPGYHRWSHLEHHKYTLLEGDPKSLINSKPTFFQLFQWMTFDLGGFLRRIVILVRNAFGIFQIPGVSIQNKIKNGARLTLLYHSTILILAISLNFKLILLLTTPAFTFTIVNKLLAISQHYGVKRAAFEPRDAVRNSRNLSVPRWLGFLYANMHYHVEHHLFPSVPYYNLKKVNRLLVRNGENIECVSFYKFLKELLIVR